VVKPFNFFFFFFCYTALPIELPSSVAVATLISGAVFESQFFKIKSSKQEPSLFFFFSQKGFCQITLLLDLILFGHPQFMFLSVRIRLHGVFIFYY